MENGKILDFERFKKDYCLDDAAITSCGFSKEELQSIYADYSNRIVSELEPLKNDFLSEFIIPANGFRFHSYSGRVKEPEHLIEKIIRKKNNNDVKYAAMKTDDYHKYITDLIGCRILLVYKEDWIKVHNHFMSVFQNDPLLYITNNDYIGGYEKKNRAGDTPFFAEEPKVYLRAGDSESLYTGISGLTIDKKGYYRSAHYIVRYGKYYVELQVRSLFEEAWGEVDHDILYPLYMGNEELVSFSGLLNRAAGMGDEMSTFFKNYVRQNAHPPRNDLLDAPNPNFLYEKPRVFPQNESQENDDRNNSESGHEPITPKDVMDQILSE